MADKYEPYEKPSAIPGLAITGAGIGALAYLARKRIPGLKILEKIAKTKTPPPPATRTPPQVVDKVTEVTKIAKTPTAQAKELIVQSHPQRNFADIKGQMDLVATKAKAAPLTQGSDQGRFGSSLYDFIAQHPSYAPLDAKVWINELSNFNRLGSFRSNQAGFQKVRMNISKAEIEDANILQFDLAHKSAVDSQIAKLANANKLKLEAIKQRGTPTQAEYRSLKTEFNKARDKIIKEAGGEEKIIGGFLKTAQESGLKVSKLDLLKMINNSPAVNLRVKRFEFVTPIMEESRILSNDLTRFVKDAEATVNSYKGTVESVRAGNKLISYGEDLYGIRGELRAVTNDVNHYMYNKNATIDSMVMAVEHYSDKIKSLEKLAKGLAEDHKIYLDVNKLREFKGHHTNLLRKMGREKTMSQSPRYGDHDTYKVLGDEKYIEDVIYYPRTMPYGRNVEPGAKVGTRNANAHYDQEKKVLNQVYHARYGRRAVDGNQGKAYVLHEGQADIHQATWKEIGRGTKIVRINPFNREQEYAQANYKLNQLLEQMKVISRNARPSVGEQIEFRKLAQQFDEIKKRTLNASNLSTKMGELDKVNVPFLPFMERGIWGDHLVKHMAKTAAEDGMKWFAINPVERVHALKRAENLAEGAVGKLGDWEFYGTATGKGGMRGVKAWSEMQDKAILTNPNMTAVLPERMKKLAFQYDSIAQPIKVAKSDPNLPFKIITKHDFRRDSAAKALKYTKAPSEHEMAFKTMDEALEYVVGTEKVVVKMEAMDPRLYYEAFGLKITPQMLQQPFKLYKKEGGLVVNMFKW